jgi:hypothetical protein
MRMAAKALSNKGISRVRRIISVDTSRSEHRLIVFRRTHLTFSRWFD